MVGHLFGDEVEKMWRSSSHEYVFANGIRKIFTFAGPHVLKSILITINAYSGIS